MGEVWVKNERNLEGNYHLYLEFGPDDVVPLDEHTAYAWVRSVLAAAMAAEYDAAVLRQLEEAGLPQELATPIVVRSRRARAARLPTSTIPGLELVPGVSALTGKGFLRLQRHGKALGQWTIADARRHAMGVLEGFEISPFDSSYRAVLIEAGVSEGTANGMVALLAECLNGGVGLYP